MVTASLGLAPGWRWIHWVVEERGVEREDRKGRRDKGMQERGSKHGCGERRLLDTIRVTITISVSVMIA